MKVEVIIMEIWEITDMIPRGKNYTIEQYEKVQEIFTDMKVEYFNGEIVMYSNTYVPHNAIIGNIVAGLKPFFKGSNCKVRTEQIEVIFKDDEETNNVKPDVFVVCHSEMKGNSYTKAPTIIFEVVSQNYADNDYIRKLKLYQKFGVLEYVIVDKEDIIHYYRNNPNSSFIVSNDKGYNSRVYSELKLTLEDIYIE